MVPAYDAFDGQHLGDDEERVARMPVDRLGHDALGAAVTVHLGGIDVGEAELETQTERGDFVSLRPAALAHVPGALADDGHLHAGRAEAACDQTIVPTDRGTVRTWATIAPVIPRFPVTALLVVALSTLGPLAHARPPDPTWPILLGRVALSTRRAG